MITRRKVLAALCGLPFVKAVLPKETLATGGIVKEPNIALLDCMVSYYPMAETKTEGTTLPVTITLDGREIQRTVFKVGDSLWERTTYEAGTEE